MQIATFKRQVRIVACFCLFFFIEAFFLSERVKADFFSTCGMDSNDVKKIDFILNKGNNKFVPHEIFDIKNKTFQDALYLLLFYKNGGAIQDDIIESIGIDVLKRIQPFRKNALNFILKTGVGFGDDARKHLISMDLELNDLLFILSNKYFQMDNYREDFVVYLLRRVFFENRLTVDDVIFLKNKFGQKVTDDFILNQVRLSLWNKDIDSSNKLEHLIANESVKKKVKKLIKFVNDVNSIRQTKTNVKNDNKMNDICSKWIGYDEYTDLVCIENDDLNKKIVKKILKNNLTPSFLPDKWLQYRVNFVRESISSDKKLSYNVYKIALNGGTLYGSDYYSQMFLAGFVAYLRNDYENAILCFNECAEHSSYADYNAKANYWLGLAYRKFGKQKMAEFCFKKAKYHIFTMYGQLAAEEVGEDPKKNIRDYIFLSDKNTQLLCDDVNFVFSYLRQHEMQYKKKNKGKQHLSELFRYFAIENKKDKEKIFDAMMIIKNDFGKDVANVFGIYTLKYGIFSDDIGFYNIPYSNDSLVNAVIKKESNFKRIIGNFGERGVMQIMPQTASSLAKGMGIKYDNKRLLEDDEYNVSIGSFYLKKLLYKYDDNKILALAAYNAGVGNVEKWISRNGNPSDMKTNEQIVNWIEKIPFFYTRSYITNILGFEMVYDVINGVKSTNSSVNSEKNTKASNLDYVVKKELNEKELNEKVDVKIVEKNNDNIDYVEQETIKDENKIEQIVETSSNNELIEKTSDKQVKLEISNLN